MKKRTAWKRLRDSVKNYAAFPHASSQASCPPFTRSTFASIDGKNTFDINSDGVGFWKLNKKLQTKAEVDYYGGQQHEWSFHLPASLILN